MFNKILPIVVGILALPVLLQAESARTEFIFPVFANTRPVAPTCDYWQSRFTVFNPNSSSTTATFTIFDGESSTGVSGTMQVNAFRFETRALAARLSAPFSVAWLKVTAPQPIMVTETVEHFLGCGSSTTISDLRGKLDLNAAEATRRQFIVVQFNRDYRIDTGISIVFPSETPNLTAQGKLIHRWVDGRTVSEKNIVIPENGQFISLITEILPEESLKFSPDGLIAGTIELIFDREVFITAIQFDAVLEDLEEHLTQPLSTGF